MAGWIVIAAVIIVVGVAAFFIVGNFFYDSAINITKKKDFIAPSPENEIGVNENPDAKRERRQKDLEFKKKAAKTVVEILSADGLKLYANKYMPDTENGAPNRKWAIVTHGYMADADSMITYSRRFYEMGFNVLAVNLRSHGGSEGKYIGMGWVDRLDMLLWIDLIVKSDPEAEIILFGISMGAATVMMTAGETLPPNIKAVIEDCGYTSVSDILSHQLKKLFGLPEFPFMHAASVVTRLRAGYGFYEGSTVAQIEKSKIPILFIHGEKDSFVPYEMLDKLYSASNAPKERFTVNTARHCESVLMDPDGYWRAVREFCIKHINLNKLGE